MRGEQIKNGVIHLLDAARSLKKTWHPRILADVNDHTLKVARLEGEFLWHDHESEDELFIVLEGRLQLNMRESSVVLEAGEAYLMPRGVEHQPVALPECLVALIEPSETRHTGNVRSERSVTVRDQRSS